jgi:hypothetical protein
MICPHCHQDAPTIVRGMRAYCTACGAPAPLSSVAASVAGVTGAVNVAGQPARIGGDVASVLGKATLTVGAVFALIAALLASIIFHAQTVLIVAAVVLVLTLLVAVPLLVGGRRLRQVGDERVQAVQEHAVFALAAQRRGVLSVGDVARALSVREEEADALLTALAKRPDGRVTLEVDDDGALTYLFHDLRPTGAQRAERVRVAEPPQPWRAPSRVSATAPGQRVIDAELIDEEEEARAQPASRRASR